MQESSNPSGVGGTFGIGGAFASNYDQIPSYSSYYKDKNQAAAKGARKKKTNNPAPTTGT